MNVSADRASRAASSPTVSSNTSNRRTATGLFKRKCRRERVASVASPGSRTFAILMTGLAEAGLAEDWIDLLTEFSL